MRSPLPTVAPLPSMLTPWPDERGQGGIRLRFKRESTRFEGMPRKT